MDSQQTTRICHSKKLKAGFVPKFDNPAAAEIWPADPLSKRPYGSDFPIRRGFLSDSGGIRVGIVTVTGEGNAPSLSQSKHSGPRARPMKDSSCRKRYIVKRPELFRKPISPAAAREIPQYQYRPALPHQTISSRVARIAQAEEKPNA